MSTLFLTVPCPPTPIIIRGSLGGFDTRRIGDAKSKEGIGRVLKPVHRARGMLSQTCVLCVPLYQFR